MHHIVGLGSPAQATSPTSNNGSYCGHLTANNGTRGRAADGAHSFYSPTNQDITMKDTLLHDFYQSCTANTPYIHTRRSSKSSPNFIDQMDNNSSSYSSKVFSTPTSVLPGGYSVLTHESYPECVQNRAQVNQGNSCSYVSPSLTHFLPR